MLVTSWFKPLFIIAFLSVSTLVESALAGSAVAVNCQSLFADSKELNVSVSVNLADVERLKTIGSGSEATVFKTKFNKKVATFRFLNSLNPESEEYLLSLLTEKQRKSLADMDVETAYRIASVDFDSELAPVFEVVQNQVARTIVATIETSKIKVLSYQGKSIAPEIYGLVRNNEGIIVGQIIEFVPGKNIFELLESLTRRQKREIYNQLIAQMKILLANGAYHGDLDPETNILVSGFPEGPLIARIVDYDQFRHGRRDPKKSAEKELNSLTEARDGRGIWQ